MANKVIQLKDGSDNLYPTTQPCRELTITRTANNFADASSISRLHAFKSGNMLHITFNFGATSAGTTSDFVEIARISGWSACSSILTCIPSQDDGSKILVMQVSSTGIISIYSAQGVAVKWYRGSFSIPVL